MRRKPRMQENHNKLENRLLQNGCVVLYQSPFLLEAHSSELASSGWKFTEVYVAKDGRPEEFFDQVAMMLEFPGYFGRNLNALNDCMGDIAFPESGRLALGLTRFDLLAHTDPAFAHAVLDIFAGVERQYLLEGKRILFLVQSSDPDLNFPVVGSSPVGWNFEEWLDSKRKKPDSSAP